MLAGSWGGADNGAFCRAAVGSGHFYCGDNRNGGAFFALIEDGSRNEPPEIFERKDYDCDVVHLADDRNEVREELDGTNDVKDCASRNRLRMPWHTRVNKRSTDDAELPEKARDFSL